MAKQETIFFEWRAPEFRHYEKSLIWYGIFAVLTVGLTLFSILNKDYFGATTTVILAGLILAFTRRRPQEVSIKVTDVGFHIGNVHVPYRYVKQFWIVETEEHRTLNLDTNTYINHTVIIELTNQDIEPIREFLSAFLPEHESTSPSFSQRIAHKFRF